MIVVDTSALIASLGGLRPAAQQLQRLIERRERMALTTLALYEWLRGPRSSAERAIQQILFPDAEALPFGPEEAELSAALYIGLARPRGRAMDIAIAACALRHQARLWTLNRSAFADIAGLELLAAE